MSDITPSLTLPSLFRLDGRIAMVTGASRGLGRAIAVGLAEAGANVLCHGTSLSGTTDTVAEIRAMGRDAWSLAADLSDHEATVALTAQAEALAGRVDILVNNAGTIRRRPAVDFTLDDWDAVMRTNLDAAFILAQRVGAGMLARGHGKIINIASLLSFQGGITVPAYTASKHALNFPVLSDTGLHVARAYGLAFDFSDDLKRLYLDNWKTDLVSWNGEGGWSLPVPATFVIGKDARVQFAHVDPDFRERSDPDEVLAVLKR